MKPIKLPEGQFPVAGMSAMRDCINWLLDQFPEEVEQTEKTLKEGVRVTKNGKYYMEGRGFIKESEAFL